MQVILLVSFLFNYNLLNQNILLSLLHEFRMRLRNVKGANDKIDNDDYTIKRPKEQKGKWKELFGNNKPIHIEIGMGKGKFIMELARKNPYINYIGIEKFSSVLVRAIEKRQLLSEELNNLYFIRMDAEELNEVFEKDEIEQIYLNFSDPWPKEKHARRRLTSKSFLDRYEKCLKKDGIIIFKTDNRKLFDFSLEQLELAGWKLKNKTYDLHHSEFISENVMTEYEEKFSNEGKSINRMVIYREFS